MCYMHLTAYTCHYYWLHQFLSLTNQRKLAHSLIQAVGCSGTRSPQLADLFLESQDLPARLRSIRGWDNWKSSSVLSAGMQRLCYGFWWAFCNLQIKTKQNQPTKSFPGTFWISSGYKNVQATKHLRPVFLHSTSIAYLYPKAKMKSLISHWFFLKGYSSQALKKNFLPKFSFGT